MSKTNLDFERICRLCAEESEASVTVFCKTELDVTVTLKDIINNYIGVEIKQTDTLPKNICLFCCGELRRVCKFISQARKNQSVLENQLESINRSNEKETNNETISELDIKKEDIQYFDNDNITEMEVNVDPMLLLQSNEGTGEEEEDEPDGLSSVSLKTLESPEVTLTLLNKKKKEQNSHDLNDKPFPCSKCSRAFLSEIALMSHSWCHFNEGDDVRLASKYQCFTCQLDFTCKRYLLQHFEQVKHNALHCSICARSFRTPENLNIHLESHHIESAGFSCKVCGKSYKTMSNLKAHYITHSSERPFKCPYCKKGFKRRQDLNFHENQHTGAKPYKCPYCDRRFASSGNCYAHRSRMHPGKVAAIKKCASKAAVPIKPNVGTITKGYKCPYCVRSFTRVENLNFHMYQHDGKMPYKCSNCKKCFLSHRSMALHMYNEHNGICLPNRTLKKSVNEEAAVVDCEVLNS